MRTPGLIGVVCGLVLLGGVALVLKRPEPSREVTRDVYVWQRAWAPAVVDAVANEGPSFRQVHILAAEVGWADGVPSVFRPDIPLEALSPLSGGYSPVLRIGPYPGPFSRDDATAGFLVDLARDILAEWHAAGIDPREFQVDFDAATARLDGYRLWIEAFRAAVEPVPLTITALPTWLPHRDFARLARATDGYVLQVHSFQSPSRIEAISPLCDPAGARRAAARASRLGVPFRVALPTYGYALLFDHEGRFLRIAAEGTAPEAFPPGSRTRLLSADPEELAGLVGEWEARPPKNLEGIVWFRLPTARDRWNWPVETLRAVCEGRVPERRLEAVAERDKSGLVRIALHNSGETKESPPGRIESNLRSAALLAGNGLNGFVWSGMDTDRLHLERGRSIAPLRPGDSIPIAWLRTTSPVEFNFSIHDYEALP